MSRLRIFTVDAFTKTRFRGNPAAVCPLETDISDDVKQRIAAEMNISETAFVTKLRSGDSFATADRFGLRWFTPTNEVPLCGHATLASTAVIFQSFDNVNDKVHFQTLSGDLVVSRSNGLYSMDMPLNKPILVDATLVRPLLHTFIGNLQVNEVQYSPATKKLLVRLDDKHDRKDLEGICPDFDRMSQCGKHTFGDVRGIIVTVRDAKGEYDFLSRYFAPWNGINEDPVTGSAHTVLAPYWTEKLGKTQFKACQWSKRRGELSVRIGEEAPDRVQVAGAALVMLDGYIRYSDN